MSVALHLPRWAHLPGTTPEADCEPLEAAKALVPLTFADGVPADHPAFRYGLRLHDGGFFWEAHEVWEAVWKAAPKNGGDRLVLRALIQLANAGLKLRMGRPQAAARLVEEAQAELAEAVRRGCAAEAGGLSAAGLDALAKHVADLGDAAGAGPLARLFGA